MSRILSLLFYVKIKGTFKNLFEFHILLLQDRDKKYDVQVFSSTLMFGFFPFYVKISMH